VINQGYDLGYVNENEVFLDYRKIARQYNSYYAKIINQCIICYHYEDCLQCFFQIDNFTQEYKCTGFSNRENFSKYLGDIISTIEENPQIIKKIMEKVVIK